MQLTRSGHPRWRPSQLISVFYRHYRVVGDRVGLRHHLICVAVAGLLTGCTPPGGSVSGQVRDLAGKPINGAAVVLHFGRGQQSSLPTDDRGTFVSAWSHGSWFESVTAVASAPGYEPRHSRIGSG